MQQAIGATLLVAGVLLLSFGYSEYQSLQSEVSEFFTGSPTDRALMMLIGGALSSVIGLVLVVRRG